MRLPATDYQLPYSTDGGRLEHHAFSGANCLPNRPCSPCTFAVQTGFSIRRKEEASNLAPSAGAPVFETGSGADRSPSAVRG